MPTHTLVQDKRNIDPFPTGLVSDLLNSWCLLNRHVAQSRVSLLKAGLKGGYYVYWHNKRPKSSQEGLGEVDHDGFCPTADPF